MDERMPQRMAEDMDAKSTAELLDIWRRRDQEKCSSAEFEAVKRILEARGEKVPLVPGGDRPVPAPPRGAGMGFAALVLVIAGIGCRLYLVEGTKGGVALENASDAQMNLAGLSAVLAVGGGIAGLVAVIRNRGRTTGFMAIVLVVFFMIMVFCPSLFTATRDSIPEW